MFDGYGELVETRAQLRSAVKRAIAGGMAARVNVKTKGHISPIVLTTTGKRHKVSSD